MATERPLLGHGDTMQIANFQETMLQKAWFHSSAGVLYTLLTAGAGYAGYKDWDAECPAGPLGKILSCKACLMVTIAILQLIVHQMYVKNAKTQTTSIGRLHLMVVSMDEGSARTSIKRFLQLQQLVFLVNLVLSLLSFYIVFASNGTVELTGIYSYLPDDVLCGWWSGTVLTFFIITWVVVIPSVVLRLPATVSKFDTFLQAGHFFAF